jgi:hypothetical protein
MTGHKTMAGHKTKINGAPRKNGTTHFFFISIARRMDFGPTQSVSGILSRAVKQVKGKGHH